MRFYLLYAIIQKTFTQKAIFHEKHGILFERIPETKLEISLGSNPIQVSVFYETPMNGKRVASYVANCDKGGEIATAITTYAQEAKEELARELQMDIGLSFEQSDEEVTGKNVGHSEHKARAVDEESYESFSGSDYNSYESDLEGLEQFDEYDQAHVAPTSEGVTTTLRPLNLINAPYSHLKDCLLYTSPSPRDGLLSRMPSSA